MGSRTVTQFANPIKRGLSPRHVNDLGRRAADNSSSVLSNDFTGKGLPMRDC